MLRKIRCMIGLLPEVPGLYETLGAYKNLDYYAQFYNISKEQREKSIKTTLTNLDLWDRRSEPVGGFSKGMKQKIAIARALIHNPKYIFLDEPTASLDPAAAKMVREYILELKSQGNTILINTHNLSEAERICDTVALVKNKTVKIGNPKTLARGLFSRTISIVMQKIPPSLLKDISSSRFYLTSTSKWESVDLKCEKSRRRQSPGCLLADETRSTSSICHRKRTFSRRCLPETHRG